MTLYSIDSLTFLEDTVSQKLPIPLVFEIFPARLPLGALSLNPRQRTTDTKGMLIVRKIILPMEDPTQFGNTVSSGHP